MRRLLIILFTFHCSLFTSFAQELKPCGTSVLARRHKMDDSASSRARLRKTPKKSAYLGEKKGLIILVEFPDIKFQSENSFQTWSDIANLHGYADNKASGSVSDYFYDQSYGQFHLTFDVVGPVEAQHEHAYYGQNIDWGDNLGWFDQNVGELVEEACLAVSSQVRFADYDWNNDGEVEQVFLLYAGHGENDYWSQDSTVIWPHMALMEDDWGYEGGLLLQDVRINTYACSNEITRSNKLAGMGTFCHEFSHCLGLPDLYNTEEGYSVVGAYDLMDQGGYNGNGWRPAGYSSYERYACGWLMPQAVEDAQTVKTLEPLHEQPDARIYRTSPDASDYYLIEYRKKERWDAYIPTAGLMAWHIDYDETSWQENTVNNDPEHLRVERMSLDKVPTGMVSFDAQGIVDITDYISGKNPQNITKASADVNGDGNVDIADILKILTAILNK